MTVYRGPAEIEIIITMNEQKKKERELLEKNIATRIKSIINVHRKDSACQKMTEKKLSINLQKKYASMKKSCKT